MELSIIGVVSLGSPPSSPQTFSSRISCSFSTKSSFACCPDTRFVSLSLSTPMVSLLRLFLLEGGSLKAKGSGYIFIILVLIKKYLSSSLVSLEAPD